jgi:hypothetical protein
MKLLGIIYLLTSLNLSSQENYSCKEYLKLHTRSDCPNNHYLKKFAFKYCSRYENRKHKFSPQGQLWIEDVKTCLLKNVMQSLENQNSCKDISKSAYVEHAVCYTNYGYCDLSVRDKRLVFFTVWDSFYNFQTLNSAFKVQKFCINSN